MSHLYDTSAPKRPANLSVNSDLLLQAKAQKINLSATLEGALKEKLIQQTHNNWLKENAQAIKANSDFIDEQGCFGDAHRVF